MKKIIVVIGLLISLIGFGQDFGKYKVVNFEVENSKVDCKNNQWYEFRSGGGFFKYFNQSPIGIKNAILEVKMILYPNNINFSDCIDSSFFSSIVKGIDDYEMLNLTIQDDSSEVKKIWDIDRKQMLTLSLEKGLYCINIIKI